MVKKDRIEQHIKHLRKFTATPGEGVTRLTYSVEDQSARTYLKAQMEAYGLVVREDSFGNVIGRLEGVKKDAPVVMVGSHFDSVPNGGAYDGTAGVVVALEIAALFQAYRLKPVYPLEVVAFVEEEGSRFGGGLMGSRAMFGELSYEDFSTLTDDRGTTTIEAMKTIGLHSPVAQTVYPHPLKAFLELHIEQGPVLEEANCSIGIVSGIVGLTTLEITVHGRAGHAGTTPMNRRADALVTASTIIAALPTLAQSVSEELVMTTGKLQVYPNGANVIPNKVVFSVDIRSSATKEIEDAVEQLKILLEEQQGCQIEMETLMTVAPTSMDQNMIDLLEKATKKQSLSYCKMPSGAGHDAMILAKRTAAGMIFVPSKDGLSHCPEEFTASEDFVNGAAVLFETIQQLTEAEQQ